MTAHLTAPRNEPETAEPKPRSGFWKLALFLIVAAAAGAGVYYSGVNKAKLQSAWNWLNQEADQMHEETIPTEPPIPVIKPAKNGPWDGLVAVDLDQETAIGFRFSEVQAQTKPIRLELTGRTAYDTTTINKVRTRFDARVEAVHVKIGDKVKKGDPLVELYSTDLASAKTDFQTKYVQWQHDLKLYNSRKQLVATGAISQQLWVDTQNDEQKSRLDFNISRDKLSVFYEIPEDELHPLLEGIGDKVVDPLKFGFVANKAKMTLRSKSDGYVIIRDVVPGNFYESTDVLMQIAPLDHLIVWVNVYELDQDKVRVGQTMDIEFPFLAQTIEGHIDYVAPEVSKDTRAVQVRVLIPNPDARLKSDMLVKAFLEIPPLPGQTVIRRLSMVALSGGEYVFVRKTPSESETTDPAKSEKEKGEKVDKFERIKIRVAQENTDTVIVAEGLQPGQTVVTNGSLILAQLYEDQRMTITGLPAQ